MNKKKFQWINIYWDIDSQVQSILILIESSKKIEEKYKILYTKRRAK